MKNQTLKYKTPYNAFFFFYVKWYKIDIHSV